MRRFFSVLATFASISLLSGTAFGITLTDTQLDGEGGDIDWYFMDADSSYRDTWNGTFDLLSAGFDPMTMTIVSVTVKFAFADEDADESSNSGSRRGNGKKKGKGKGDNNSGENEQVTIQVGSETLWSDEEVNGSHSGGYQWFIGSLSASLMSDLSDGLIDYQIEAADGDFYLKEASIEAEVDWLKVPDTGTTLSLFGLGVGILLVLRRQMSNK